MACGPKRFASAAPIARRAHAFCCLWVLQACGYVGYERVRVETNDTQGPNLPLEVGEGDGHWGPLQISTGEQTPNAYFALQEDITPGSSKLRVLANDMPLPRAGDLLLVWHTRISLEAAQNAASPFSLATTGLGQWEFRRLSEVSGEFFESSTPSVYGYPAAESQVIVVPEYSSVDVGAAASLLARAWDGTIGGALVLLANEGMRIEGLVSAHEAGCRGGEYVIAPIQPGCTRVDEPLPGGAQKGESLVVGSYGESVTGRGAILNGAGGGICSESAGGGGAHQGAGGQGGVSTDGQRPVGGRGGIPFVYPEQNAFDRLTIGGGGGAGQGDGSFVVGASSNPSGLGSGGPAGGIVWLRSPYVDLPGRIEADASSALRSSALTTNGAGGGGAGGLVWLEAETLVRCNVIDAVGGRGGNAGAANAPGGGGGGGRVVVRTASSTPCDVRIAGGAAGETNLEEARGAEPGEDGRYLRLGR